MTTLPPPPEGGADPHRDDWVPVPLRAKKYDPETNVYFIEFEAPKQLLLNPQYSAMVHDELLRNADRDGLLIEGQIVITETDKTPPPPVEQKPLVEGEPMQVEQDAVESPYKMSDRERKFREQMAARNQETLRAFGLGEPVIQPPQRETMIVRAEALVAMDMGAANDDVADYYGHAPNKDIDIERVMLDIEIPDDLSGLDG